MAAASYQKSSDARRRPGALALAIAAHLLVIWLLLRIAPDPFRPPQQSAGPSTFRLLPMSEQATKPAATKTRVAKQKSAAATAAKSAPKPPTPRPPTPRPPVEPPHPDATAAPPWPDMIGGKDLFRLADVAKLPSHPEDKLAATAGASGSGKTGDSSTAYGPGEGPSGERLYNADWFVEPSSSQINPYLPASAPPVGWGLVACRTIPRNQVDNCRTLGESPVGSGYGRTVRLAAWQFRVIPPRVGGRSMVGAWVRIRITFSQGAIEKVD